MIPHCTKIGEHEIARGKTESIVTSACCGCDDVSSTGRTQVARSPWLGLPVLCFKK
jgi:hypothetical protein